MISFEVPGEPKAKGRVRFTKAGFAFTPKKTVSFENRVAVFGLQAFCGLEKIEGPVRLDVTFCLKRPKRLMRKNDPDGLILCCKKPDLSNLVKSIEDGLNDIAYDDDRQITMLVLRKFYCEKFKPPRTIITVQGDKIHGGDLP